MRGGKGVGAISGLREDFMGREGGQGDIVFYGVNNQCNFPKKIK